MLMISDNLWNQIESIIPKKKSNIGRPLKDSKLILSGILYIMITGAQWRNLPDYYGKPSTAHGRFMTWVKAGLFSQILAISIQAAISELGNPESFFADTSSVKAPLANFGGKNPTDRAKNGVKKGIVIDWNRIILSVIVGAANRHDSHFLMPHLGNIKSFFNKPKVLATDSAWDAKKFYKELAKHNIALMASTNVRRNKNKPKIKPGGRWKIEQVFGNQHWNRGIKFCWTKTCEAFLALCQLASSIHNFKLIGIFV